MMWIVLLAIAAFFLAANFMLAPLLRCIRLVSGENAPVPGRIRSISIIVPAYNEEQSIGEKIETIREALRGIDLEAEVIIGSDGSTDRTAEIATGLLEEMNDPRWKVVEFANEGKCQTINRLVRLSSGDVIISTDADIPLPEYAFDLVIRSFQSNAKLGCLSCIPCFTGLSIGSQKSYWRVEDRIRHTESALGKLIVVTGMLYAYKRVLFEEIPKGVMADDLWVPLVVLLKGHESVQGEELLVPYEKTDEKTEVLRRQRVIVGGMDVVGRLLPRLICSPFLLGLVFFHKINRWAFPLWFFMLAGSLLILWPWLIFLYLTVGVLGFWYLGKNRFTMLARAGLTPILSFAEFVRKSDFARWEHTRKHTEV